MDDTIYALSTAVGNGVAVVRVSGPGAEHVLRQCFNRTGAYETHKLYYGKIIDGADIVDDALATFMRGPHSYTGEDVAEFHCHGGGAVVARVMQSIAAHARLAQPGEFSRRAFLNGKLALGQAEAVMDLIAASTEQSAGEALRQLGGSLTREVCALQGALTDAIAQLEALLDYPEEDWDGELAAVAHAVAGAKLRVNTLIESFRQGAILRSGLNVVLLGRPNVGKSTLLNALLGRERAIVAASPGTTRDTLEEPAELAGIPVRLTDTAGLRAPADDVEAEGVARTRAAAERAELLLVVVDGSVPLATEDREALALAAAKPHIVVLTKCDLPPVVKNCDVAQAERVVRVCAKANEVQPLLMAIRAHFDALAPADANGVAVTNARHADALRDAAASLTDASAALACGACDGATIDLRAAWHALGQITGETVDDVILDTIFSRFCLGK